MTGSHYTTHIHMAEAAWMPATAHMLQSSTAFMLALSQTPIVSQLRTQTCRSPRPHILPELAPAFGEQPADLSPEAVAAVAGAARRQHAQALPHACMPSRHHHGCAKRPGEP